ncbi:MAG: serine/threonine-protein kinase, partial [Planctomycetota bacterium]|nr:serine/threonine-protein kinase [Planctomycetota bacterium]
MANDQELARHLIAQNIIQESHWNYWLQCREAGDTRSFGVFLTEHGYLASDAVSLVNYQLSNTVPVRSEMPTQFVAPVPEKMLLSEEGLPLAIGQFRIIGILGRGGFGIVYESESESGEKVAIKVLISPTVDNLARFEREQRLVALFGFDQGYVPLLKTGTFDGGPYFVMPLMTGGSLKDRIKKFDYSIEEAIELLMTLGRSVALAHREGVVHRDLKPDNILFDSEDRPYITDLGLAKHFSNEGKGADQSVSLSIAGQGYGTPGYMAPEQMKNAKDVGPETDIFALGSIFFYCLTGRIPFYGQAVVEITANVIKGQQLSLRDFRDDCPAAIHAFVNRCLAEDPENRFADGDEFVAELELARAPVSASNGPLIASVIGALLLVVSVFVGLQLWISSNQKQEVKKVDGGGQDPSKTDKPKDEKGGQGVNPLSFTPPKRDLNKPFVEGFKNCRLKRVLGSRDMRHPSLVTCCTISPDGRFGASGSLGGVLKIFDIETGKTLWEKKRNRIDALAFSPDSRRLFVSAEKVVEIWDWVNDVPLRSLRKHTNLILSVELSADGKYC